MNTEALLAGSVACVLCFSIQAGFVEGDFELRHVLFYGGCGFTIMRCMSFALENCERKDGNYSILELLKYNFYLPFFYFGPIMTFDKFYVQVGEAFLVSSIVDPLSPAAREQCVDCRLETRMY